MDDLNLKVGKTVYHEKKGKGLVIQVGGIVLKDRPITVRYFAAPKPTYLYTIDGRVSVKSDVVLFLIPGPIIHNGIYHLDLRQKWLDLAIAGAENKWEYRPSHKNEWSVVLAAEPIWREHIEYRRVPEPRYVAVCERNTLTASNACESLKDFRDRTYSHYAPNIYTIYKMIPLGEVE